jgi:branched-chain amino acid transport system ATP-binding protein
MSVLAISGLEVRYGKAVGVTRADLTVAEGECVGIVGPNGAGKSSVLRVASGLVAPAAGSVELFGSDVTKRPSPQRRGAVLVPEGRHVFPTLTVRENLLAGGYTLSRRDRPARLTELLERFPLLAERADRDAGLLSGGHQQVLAIARGLMSHPRLLMIDEFSLGLSPANIDAVAEVVSSIVATGVAALVVEQNPAVVRALCARVYLMKEGRTVGEFSGESSGSEIELSYIN